MKTIFHCKSKGTLYIRGMDLMFKDRDAFLFFYCQKKRKDDEKCKRMEKQRKLL